MNSSTKKLEINSKGILTFRESLGLTQEQLGNRLDVSGNYVWMLESGQKPISDKIARKLKDLSEGKGTTDLQELESWRQRALNAEKRLEELRAGMSNLLKKI